MKGRFYLWVCSPHRPEEGIDSLEPKLALFVHWLICVVATKLGSSVRTAHWHIHFTTKSCFQSSVQESLCPFFGVRRGEGELMHVLGHLFIGFDRGSGMDTGEGAPRRSLLLSTMSMLTYTYYVFSVSSLASLMCLHASAPINHRCFSIPSDDWVSASFQSNRSQI